MSSPYFDEKHRVEDLRDKKRNSYNGDLTKNISFSATTKLNGKIELYSLWFGYWFRA